MLQALYLGVRLEEKCDARLTLEGTDIVDSGLEAHRGRLWRRKAARGRTREGGSGKAGLNIGLKQ